MNTSSEISELAAALAKAQAQFKAVKTDSNARITTKAGAVYEYSYASLAAVLDAIRDALAANGLSVVQSPETANGAVTVTTYILHSSGEWLSGQLSYPYADADIKALGAIISYLRRYSLVAMLGLAWEDDDGSSVPQRPASPSQPPPSNKPAPPSNKPAPPSQTPPEQFPIADEPVETEADQAANHWLHDENTRRAFYARRNKLLKEAGIAVGWELLKRQALGVEHLMQYAGTPDDALNAISAWIAKQVNK